MTLTQTVFLSLFFLFALGALSPAGVPSAQGATSSTCLRTEIRKKMIEDPSFEKGFDAYVQRYAEEKAKRKAEQAARAKIIDRALAETRAKVGEPRMTENETRSEGRSGHGAQESTQAQFPWNVREHEAASMSLRVYEVAAIDMKKGASGHTDEDKKLLISAMSGVPGFMKNNHTYTAGDAAGSTIPWADKLLDDTIQLGLMHWDPGVRAEAMQTLIKSDIWLHDFLATETHLNDLVLERLQAAERAAGSDLTAATYAKQAIQKIRKERSGG